jgi:SAM-dependent methyltransferase
MQEAEAERAISRAKKRPEFPALLEASVVGWDPLGADLPEFIGFMRDPLLHSLLGEAIACDPDLERVLTHLRRCLLLHPDGDAVTFEFACALASQCFNTEYSYVASDDETRQLNQFETQLDAVLQAAPSPSAERLLALAAMYAPLHRLRGWERMTGWRASELSETFRPLWQEQVVHHREERDIADQIEALTPIRDAVSGAVREQYEANPYPRWLCFPPPPPQARRGSILVAGCGTGRHPIYTALTYPDCEVLAVDLSRASLAYGVRMARRLGANNVTFRQADILELGALDRRFDQIEAIGVLHHLEDPLAGWRVLARLLQPGGSMRVALYSETARRRLGATRDFIRERGFAATEQDIRRCRREILDLPADHAARAAMESDDFYSCSGFRDLVMHVRERRFTLPQIAGCLAELGLELQALLCAPELKAKFQATFPDPAALADLARWHEFEQRHPDSFRGMYQFFCGGGLRYDPSPRQGPDKEISR